MMEKHICGNVQIKPEMFCLLWKCAEKCLLQKTKLKNPGLLNFGAVQS